MSSDWPDLPDDKNPKVFRHAKCEPEEPKHKSRWDRSKCKRNKGSSHDMVLIKDDLRRDYEYRWFRVPGFRVWERRPTESRNREWRCSFCNKKEIEYGWSNRKPAGEWEEYRRVEDRRQPK